MADKAIGSLVQTTTLGLNDLLVLEQDNTAKSISGQNLVNLLAAALDGHGGIVSIAKTSSSGTNPKVDTYTITFADESTTTFTVTNGLKGNKGDQTYVWIRYASRQPVADSDLTTTPDKWIGIYVGTSATAPTTRGSYTWYEYKGEKGDTGDPAELDVAEIRYQAGSSGTEVPTGTWSSTIPVVAQGQYLWTRTTLEFNSGSPVVSYSVSRIGVDGTGTGTVQSVNDVQPDANGNVVLNADDIPTSSTDTVQDTLTSLGTQVAGRELRKLQFTNTVVPTTAFASDVTYSDYPYKATVPLSGALSSMTPNVIFAMAEATSGVFAPVCESYNGGIYLYATEVPASSITIPNIILWKNNA